MVTEFNKKSSSPGNPLKKVLLKIKNLTPIQKKALLTGTAISTVLAGWGLYELGGGQGFRLGFGQEDATEENGSSEQVTLPANVQTAGTIQEGMTFDQAFVQSRKELGAGGLFEYKGQLFNNFTSEEWNALSSEQKAEYLASIEDRISTDPQEIQQAQEEGDDAPFDAPSEEAFNDSESDFEMPDQNATDDATASIPGDYPVDNDAGIPADLATDDDAESSGLSASDLVDTAPAPPTASTNQQPAAAPNAAAAVPNTNESGTTAVATSTVSHAENELQAGGNNPTIMMIDADKNHIIEAHAADFDHDGSIDLMAVDSDQDGLFDTFYLDLDATTATDLDTIAYDNDGDGKFDKLTNLETSQVVTADQLKPFEATQGSSSGSEITTMDDPLPEMDGAADVTDFQYDNNA